MPASAASSASRRRRRCRRRARKAHAPKSARSAATPMTSPAMAPGLCASLSRRVSARSPGRKDTHASPSPPPAFGISVPVESVVVVYVVVRRAPPCAVYVAVTSTVVVRAAEEGASLVAGKTGAVRDGGEVSGGDSADVAAGAGVVCGVVDDVADAGEDAEADVAGIVGVGTDAVDADESDSVGDTEEGSSGKLVSAVLGKVSEREGPSESDDISRTESKERAQREEAQASGGATQEVQERGAVAAMTCGVASGRMLVSLDRRARAALVPDKPPKCTRQHRLHNAGEMRRATRAQPPLVATGPQENKCRARTMRAQLKRRTHESWVREACALVGGALVGGAVVGGAVVGGAVRGAVVAVVPDGARAEVPSETDVGGAAEEAGGVAVWEEEAGVLGLVGDVVGRGADVGGCEEVVFADVDVADAGVPLLACEMEAVDADGAGVPLLACEMEVVDAGVLLLAGMDSVDADAEGVLMAVESV
ncbi:hypothetical protein PHLGIDRAFT_122726 [Phlebiopsis gigantea 11061_1 CR5-6]|uniref:Uncharacterized protein n=1 Tax=Phlebiopsis gigantea (strain 11061_1 CR5-6) TaxID=745531 RepID=A0A0C3NCB4_PHLG1|nr:hypothetical protein PHLGIDRAFT_122726 [Phlebiopsis gigantea 11061_1 CR5-6]